jgi:hypothetical protein
VIVLTGVAVPQNAFGLSPQSTAYVCRQLRSAPNHKMLPSR